MVQKRLFVALNCMLFALVLALGMAPSAHAGAGGGDPKARIVIGDGTPPGTPDTPRNRASQALYNAKTKLAAQYAQVRQGTMKREIFEQHFSSFLHQAGDHAMAAQVERHTLSTTSNIGILVAKEMKLEVWQRPQIKSYYCGPGSAYSMLEYLQVVRGKTSSVDGEALSQTTLAQTKYLETERWLGSPWSTNNGHPYPEALSYWITGNYYNLYTYTNGPNLTLYKDDLTVDITYRFPLAANTVEVANGTHYNGHPVDRAVYHWIALRGYNNYGDTTYYVDPAANASTVGWANVQPYAIIPSTSMVTFINARGLVW